MSATNTVKVTVNGHQEWEVYGVSQDGGVYGSKCYHRSKAPEAFSYLNQLAESSRATIDSDGCDPSFLESLNPELTAHHALTELGYSICDTGGGIEQYIWVHQPTGRERIISTPEAELPESLDEPVIVCDYEDGQQVGETVSYATLREALSQEQRPS